MEVIFLYLLALVSDSGTPLLTTIILSESRKQSLQLFIDCNSNNVIGSTKTMQTRVLAAAATVLVGLIYKAIQPPPPKLCGSPNGPPITSPRIRLSDGRYLAYREVGTQKEKANYKIILVHNLDGTKDLTLPVSQELMDELGIYILSFDRAGYAESDPNPKRSAKSEANDIEELADQLEIGEKFYLIGVSMGGYPVWGCLNYIPHRLLGAALVVPVVNYWWPSFPANLSREAYRNMLVQDQRTLWIAHYAPSLFYAWMNQKWFPTLAPISRMSVSISSIFSDEDVEIYSKRAAVLKKGQFVEKARQQGVYESIHRDIMVLCGNWEFDPMNMSNPFPKGEGSVHIWQGRNDKLVPVELQRYVAHKLPWIQYHEVPTGGHLFMFVESWANAIIKSLLIKQEPAATL